jgi:hypothetical protein
MVTEAFKGRLYSDGNRVDSAKAQAGLTARLASQADAKAGLSDPTILRGRVEAHRIKVTLGITG